MDNSASTAPAPDRAAPTSTLLDASPLTAAEVGELWEFVHGDIMVGGIRSELRSSLGLCPHLGLRGGRGGAVDLRHRTARRPPALRRLRPLHRPAWLRRRTAAPPPRNDPPARADAATPRTVLDLHPARARRQPATDSEQLRRSEPHDAGCRNQPVDLHQPVAAGDESGVAAPRLSGLLDAGITGDRRPLPGAHDP